MIHINLLPEEYRRTARTPLKLMVAVTAAVTVNALLLAWYGWLALGVAAGVESELTVLQTEADGLAPQVAYHRSLEQEEARHEARETTLAEINSSRISWTRKLDQFVDVVNRGNDGDRHLVWFDTLAIAQEARGGRGGGAGGLTAGGHSGSDNFGHVANFLDDLEESPFIEDFERPAPPEGSETQKDEELMPAVVWAFPLSVTLKEKEASR